MLEISKMCDNARYSDILEKVINDLGGIGVLRLDFEANYQGYVDIDVALKDGRIYSYKYFYGSCAGCDEWEDGFGFEKEPVYNEMTNGTFFDNIGQYEKWRKNCRGE